MNSLNIGKRTLWLGAVLALVLVLAGSVFTAVTQASIEAGAITGIVTDPDGGLPPADTHVKILSGNGDVHGQATLLADGSFSIGPVRNGNYILQAKPPADSGLTPTLPVSLQVTGDPVDVGTLPLTNPTITGAVFAPDGVTAETAVVHVYKSGHLIQSVPAPDGDIQIGGLLSGTYKLQAFPTTDDPYWKSAREPITVTDGVSQTVDLTLQDATVVGTIVDPNGVGVAGAVVHVVGRDTHQRHRDSSSASGYFAIGDLPDDTYFVYVEPPFHRDGFVPPAIETFTVPPEFTDLGELALRDAPKIVQGIVKTNTDVPVENALVVATRRDHPGQQEALTDAAGHYTLHLSGGLWSLTVRHTDASNPADWLYPHAPKAVHFDRDYQPEHKTVNFNVVTADSEITGLVEMPDGTAPPFTSTVSVRNNRGIGRSVIADPADGSFSVMVPHGNYVLSVHAADPAYSGPEPQQVAAPENGSLDVGTLTLIARDATISGIITDSNGDPVEGIQVIAWTRHHQGARATTGPDGGYVLAVMPGEWHIKPHVPADMPFIYSGEALTATVESMDDLTGFDFELDEADNLVEGQLVDPADESVSARGWATAFDEDGPVNGAPIESGSFSLYLPDGDFEIRVRLGPDSDWLPGVAQPVSVSGGETVNLDFPVLPRNAEIVGTLWDPRREVVPTGVNGHVTVNNPFAWVGDSINPANGSYKLDVSAGIWHMSYDVAPDSGYVVLDHHKVVPIEANQTLAVPLPVAKKDAAFAGVVLQPDGTPLAGAVVVANGVAGDINQVTLRTHTNDAGEFLLRVPHGTYRLHAAYANDAWMSPVARHVTVRRNGAINDIELQFRESDVTLSGGVSLAADGASFAPPADGLVHIWAYSDDGAATKTTVELGETYTLNLLSDMTWHIGAVLETGERFYGVRTAIEMEGDDETLDLVLEGPFAKPGPVVVTFDADEEQEIHLPDGTMIAIPAGAMPVDGEVTLHITPIATFPHQHHARLYKYGYAFVALDEDGNPITSNFDQNVTIRFKYEDGDLARLGLREGRLRPAYFSTSTQSWTVPESYAVNSAANWVTMQIDHFTDFSLLNSSAGYEVFLPSVIR